MSHYLIQTVYNNGTKGNITCTNYISAFDLYLEQCTLVNELYSATSVRLIDYTEGKRKVLHACLEVWD
jgi:hypothetical protein